MKKNSPKYVSQTFHVHLLQVNFHHNIVTFFVCMQILQIKKKRKDWDKMIKHAQECSLEGKLELKSYSCAERNVVLFFNYVHRLVGAKFDGCYVTSDKFEPAQRVNFVISAYLRLF